MTAEVFGRIEATIGATVRSCTEADLPALEWLGLYAPDRGIIRQAFEGQRRGDQLMLLAIATGFPIAQVWIDLARKRSERTAVIWAVRTFPPLQRAGIGTGLLRIAERALRERGIGRAELEVEPADAGAIAFYASLGWRAARTDRGEGSGFRIMEKRLDGPAPGGLRP